jgi:hypothetical protein
MLKSLLIALSIASLFSGRAIASDIGGAPVKAVTPQASYSTIFSQTNFIDPFGIPRSIIIVAPPVTYDSFGIVSTPHYPQTVIVTPHSQTTIVRGILKPGVPIHPIQSSSCGTLTLGLASGRSVSIHSTCW